MSTLTKTQQQLVDQTFAAISKVVRVTKARVERRDFRGAASAAADAQVMLEQLRAKMLEISALEDRSVA